VAGTAHHRAQHWQCQPTLLLSRQVGRCLVLHWLWVWAGTCSCSDTAQARLLLRHGLPHALTGMPRCHTVSREQSQRFAWFATQDATTSSGRRWLPQPAAHALLLWRGAGGIQAVSVPRATQGDECAGSCEVLLAWRSGSRCGPVGLGLNTWRRACPAGPKTQPCPASCARSSPTATRCAGWLAGWLAHVICSGDCYTDVAAAMVAQGRRQAWPRMRPCCDGGPLWRLRCPMVAGIDIRQLEGTRRGGAANCAVQAQ